MIFDTSKLIFGSCERFYCYLKSSTAEVINKFQVQNAEFANLFSWFSLDK